MNEELAIEILKQATIETTTGACEKCPRKGKNKTCIGCLDEAKEKILSEIKRLSTDKEQLTSLVNSCQEEIRKLKEQLQQKENIIKEAREYIEENEKEYGSLEDNEKIILGILDKENQNENN